MIRKLFCTILSTLALLILWGCQKSPEVKNTEKVQVYTSMYPLEDFAKKIGGEYVNVTNLVPPGTEPHDFELSAKERVKLTNADVLAYNGAGFEDWIEKAAQTLDTKKTTIVNTSEALPLFKKANGKTDPHIWLDPQLAKAQARSICNALVKVDQTHAKNYENNYVRLAKQFDQLDKEYKEMVSVAPKREFVVSHSAFHYLAKRYGLEQIAVTGISPMEEPSPKELQNLINTMKEHQVNYIFFETLASNKLANVIKKEVGAKSLILNPLEGLTKEELAQGEDYFSVMKKNKENLAIALGKK